MRYVRAVKFYRDESKTPDMAANGHEEIPLTQRRPPVLMCDRFGCPAHPGGSNAVFLHVCHADVRNTIFDVRTRLQDSVGNWTVPLYPLHKANDGITSFRRRGVAKYLGEYRLRERAKLLEALASGGSERVGLVEDRGDPALLVQGGSNNSCLSVVAVQTRHSSGAVQFG